MNHTFCFLHHRWRGYAIALISIVMGLLSSSSLTAEESCTQLLTDRCESCHYLTRVCQKVDREMNKQRLFGGPEGTWKRTINNMVRQGAKLTDAEEQVLVTCLSRPTPELLNLCNLKK